MHRDRRRACGGRFGPGGRDHRETGHPSPSRGFPVRSHPRSCRRHRVRRRRNPCWYRRRNQSECAIPPVPSARPRGLHPAHLLHPTPGRCAAARRRQGHRPPGRPVRARRTATPAPGLSDDSASAHRLLAGVERHVSCLVPPGQLPTRLTMSGFFGRNASSPIPEVPRESVGRNPPPDPLPGLRH